MRSPLLFVVGLSSVVAAQNFTTRSWEEATALASALVANLTNDEKVGIATGRGNFVSRCVGDTHAVNRSLPGAPDGLPSFCLNDGPAGMRAVELVTGFPTGINVASTFSRRLMRARGQAIAEEFRGKGAHVFLGPAVDIMRAPEAGRLWEAFGPEPYLAGESAFETISGVQSVGVQACAKHFTAYIQEHYRYTFSSSLDDRTMHEIYLWPFMRAVDANVSSVMCAYNQVDGTYSCGNEDLLGPSGLLRSMGFQGYVVSDWGATHPTTSQYANAGLDMEQPGDFILIGGGIYGSSLSAAVADGSVSQSRLDQMATRIVTPWFRLGQDQGYPPVNFDAQNPDGSGSLNLHVNVRTDAHTQLVREIGGASTVLLKNEGGVLPLSGNYKKVALIGLDLAPPEMGCSLNACNGGTVAHGWGSGTILLDFVVPPITALTEHLNSSSPPPTVVTSATNDQGMAVAAATGADVALVFVNAMSGELGALQEVDGNFGDRNDLDLWFKGGSMIEAVSKVNKNTIVVIHSTGPVLMGPWADFENVTALVYAGAPGEQTGPAIVDVLYGATNPSGRLPFTIAIARDDYPADVLYVDINPAPTITFNDTLFTDYRHFDQASIAPRFEFGFGLSYTNFSYSGLTASSSSVSFTLTNSGGRSGTEIPQLYLGFPSGAGEPPKVLRGFDDVALDAGQSTTVTFALTDRDLSIWDTSSQSWVRPAGTFGVFVGASSRDIRLTGSF